MMNPSTFKLPQRLSHVPYWKIIKSFRLWETHEKKIATFRNHLHFTLHCKHHKVTPPSLTLKCAMRGRNTEIILQRAQRALTNERINDIKRKLIDFELNRADADEYLFTHLPSDVYTEIKVWMKRTHDNTFDNIRHRQKAKFERLYTKKRTEDVKNNGPIVEVADDEANLIQGKWVIDLSKITLSNDKRSLLKKGLSHPQ